MSLHRTSSARERLGVTGALLAGAPLAVGAVGIGMTVSGFHWVAGALALTLAAFLGFASVYLRRRLRQIAAEAGDVLKAADEARAARAEAEQARAEANAARTAKAEFLSRMSHELRTPLNAILGYSELIHEELEASGDARLLPDVARIRLAAQRQLALVDDILDLARNEGGALSLHLETFDVARFVEEVAAAVGPVSARRGRRIEVSPQEGLETMTTDRSRLRRALVHLLNNAANHTERGVIELAVQMVPGGEGGAGADWLRFTVRDTGEGLEPERLTRILQGAGAGAGAAPGARPTEGAGLGLALTRGLCEAMGGSLSVQSEPGRGSAFSLTLPRTAPVGGPAPATAMPVCTPDADGPLILVADDDENTRDLVCRRLARAGYRTAQASTGIECVERARTLLPAAITLDIVMPGMDGWTALAALKADPATAGTPVVLVSVIDDRRRGVELGAVDCLTKPIDWVRLLAVLRSARPAAAGPTVLIVDDDDDLREWAARMLGAAGWSVAGASNGREALDLVKSLHPAAILLDLMMPELDGFQFLDALGEAPGGRAVPVIVMTNKDVSAEERRRLDGQARSVLTKAGLRFDRVDAELRGALAGAPRAPHAHAHN